jgi:acetylornithine deacetylase/succinyl-diaminopimelate desuccinylase-like protein
LGATAKDGCCRIALTDEDKAERDLFVKWCKTPSARSRSTRSATSTRGSAKAAADLGYSSMEIVSGAAHDACYIAEIAPTGMIFIPCDDSISHNEIENIEPEQRCTAVMCRCKRC